MRERHAIVAKPPAPRVSVSNDELVTVRDAMRELNRMVERLDSDQIDKFVLTKHGKMLAALVPLKDVGDA